MIQAHQPARWQILHARNALVEAGQNFIPGHPRHTKRPRGSDDGRGRQQAVAAPVHMQQKQSRPGDWLGGQSLAFPELRDGLTQIVGLLRLGGGRGIKKRGLKPCGRFGAWPKVEQRPLQLFNNFADTEESDPICGRR